jgi:hypothetical protein
MEVIRDAIIRLAIQQVPGKLVAPDASAIINVVSETEKAAKQSSAAWDAGITKVSEAASKTAELSAAFAEAQRASKEAAQTAAELGAAWGAAFDKQNEAKQLAEDLDSVGNAAKKASDAGAWEDFDKGLAKVGDATQQAAEKQDSYSQALDRSRQLSVQAADNYAKAAEGALKIARGLILLGEGNESLEKIARSVAQVQGAIDLLNGGIAIIKNLAEAKKASAAASAAAAASEVLLATTTTAAGAAAASATPAFVVMGVALGPISVAILAIGAALTAGAILWRAFGDDGEEALEKIEDGLRKQQQALDAINLAIDEQDKKYAARANRNSERRQFQSETEQVASLGSEIEQIQQEGIGTASGRRKMTAREAANEVLTAPRNNVSDEIENIANAARSSLEREKDARVERLRIQEQQSEQERRPVEQSIEQEKRQQEQLKAQIKALEEQQARGAANPFSNEFSEADAARLSESRTKLSDSQSKLEELEKKNNDLIEKQEQRAESEERVLNRLLDTLEKLDGRIAEIESEQAKNQSASYNS